MPFVSMTFGRVLVCCVLLSATMAAGAQDKAVEKKLYCWDEGGRKVCGDALPPEAVNRARTEFNAKSGMRTNVIGRALTADEQAAQSAAAQLRAAAADAEAARKRRDIALSVSYSSEDELRKAYQVRFDLIDETIKASQLTLTNLQKSLQQLLNQANEQELAGKKVSLPLTQNIRKQHADLEMMQANYATQRRERIEIDQNLQAALVRYREMKRPGLAASKP